MKKTLTVTIAALFALSASICEAAQRELKQGARQMTRKQLIDTALSAAPERISMNAGVMIQGADGKFEVVRKGANGFTCVPDIDGQETPSPMCADEATLRFFMDMWSGKDRPSNTTVGVAYMAKGGWHWEKDGRAIMSMDKDAPGAKRVREPAHWMIIFPFDPERSLLPTVPGIFGSWIMFEGTPFAHLMIYQDPLDLDRTPEEMDDGD